MTHHARRDRARARARRPAQSDAQFDAERGNAGGAVAGSVTLPRPETTPPKTQRARARRPDAVPRPAAIQPTTASEEHLPARGPRRLRLTWESAAYLVLLLAAALTRFWDLGSRALHHDESLHAYYSWVLATGGNYEHDPLMHGPFLFLANAFVYLVLGDSDATSRFMPALFGTILVGLPWFLRGPRFLGRYGALAASALFLISPGFLYYSRYIRHDMYTVVGALLLFICLARYIEKPARGWLIGAGAAIAFLYANHEIVFALVAIFVAYLWGALLWGRLRAILPFQIGAAAFIAATVLAWPALGGRGMPRIPWDRGGDDAPQPTRDNQIDFYVDLLTHPLVLLLLALVTATIVGCWWVLREERRRRGPLLEGSPPGTIEAATLAAWRDKTGLVAALAVAGVIFAALFTTLFTNVYGLASGTIATDGTLLYWLGQQDVRRGNQPWFYFLLLAPQYELILVTFGIAGAVVTLWRTWLSWRDPDRTDPSLFFRLWLTVWFGLVFLGLSYAGEKMPWLIVHFTLPGLLLAGGLLGDLTERAIGAWRGRAVSDRPISRFGRWAEAAWLGPGLVVALLALAGGWFFLAADLTYGEFARPNGALRRVVTDEALDRWWLLALAPLAAIVLLGFAWLARNAAFAGRWATVALVLGLVLLQVHVAWRLSFLQGDDPKDMIIYNTTSPDVTRMMREIGILSDELTGGKDIVIWYDNDTAWPMQWYLRDFPNRRYVGPSLEDEGQPPEGVAVVLVSNENIAAFQPFLANYTPQEYVMRWHGPEDATYRHFAIAPELAPGWSAWGSADNPHGIGAIIGSVGDSLATQTEPNGQQRLYRIVMYRELTAPYTVYNYTVFVRNDLIPLLNSIRY